MNATVGDIFVLPNPTDIAFFMAIIREHPDDKDLFLCVPVDDVEIFIGHHDLSEQNELGLLVARLGYSVWLSRKHFVTRVGVFGEQMLKSCQQKMAKMVRGTDESTNNVTENDPNYWEIQETIAKYVSQFNGD